MNGLLPLVALPRVLRHGSRVGADLPADEAVLLDAADPQLRDALRKAVVGGDHVPVRDVLAETRKAGEWERRSSYVAAAAKCALRSSRWMDAWLAEDPEDPDVVLVSADLAVDRAWAVRSSLRARYVSKQVFATFHSMLCDAVPVISAAVELNPADPVPWRVALQQARGVHAPRDVFDAYLAEVSERAPDHFDCHYQALQYLCRKWYGSHEEMFDFAERAADEASPDSLLRALPVMAAVEYVTDGPGPRRRGGFQDRVDAAIAGALDLSARYGPGDREAARFRNHLAFMLMRRKRWAEALVEFGRTGAHATTYPWAYVSGDDSRQVFLAARKRARLEVAARTPLFRAAG